jgi:hypothetical protein
MPGVLLAIFPLLLLYNPPLAGVALIGAIALLVGKRMKHAHAVAHRRAVADRRAYDDASI